MLSKNSSESNKKENCEAQLSSESRTTFNETTMQNVNSYNEEENREQSVGLKRKRGKNKGTKNNKSKLKIPDAEIRNDVETKNVSINIPNSAPVISEQTLCYPNNELASISKTIESLNSEMSTLHLNNILNMPNDNFSERVEDLNRPSNSICPQRISSSKFINSEHIEYPESTRNSSKKSSGSKKKENCEAQLSSESRTTFNETTIHNENVNSYNEEENREQSLGLKRKRGKKDVTKKNKSKLNIPDAEIRNDVETKNVSINMPNSAPVISEQTLCYPNNELASISKSIESLNSEMSTLQLKNILNTLKDNFSKRVEDLNRPSISTCPQRISSSEFINSEHIKYPESTRNSSKKSSGSKKKENCEAQFSSESRTTFDETTIHNENVNSYNEEENREQSLGLKRKRGKKDVTKKNKSKLNIPDAELRNDVETKNVFINMPNSAPVISEQTLYYPNTQLASTFNCIESLNCEVTTLQLNNILNIPKHNFYERVEDLTRPSISICPQRISSSEFKNSEHIEYPESTRNSSKKSSESNKKVNCKAQLSSECRTTFNETTIHNENVSSYNEEENREQSLGLKIKRGKKKGTKNNQSKLKIPDAELRNDVETKNASINMPNSAPVISEQTLFYPNTQLASTSNCIDSLNCEVTTLQLKKILNIKEDKPNTNNDINLGRPSNSTSNFASCQLINNSKSLSSKYIQNVVDHPLLNSKFNMHCPNQREMSSVDFVYSSSKNKYDLGKKGKAQQKKKIKDKITNDNNFKFDPYITIEQAESGLRNKTLLEGTIRINPKQYQHSYVSATSDRSEQDILIVGIKNRNRALEGDHVVVQIINDSDIENDDVKNQKMGKVVFIKSIVHTRKCIGTLQLMPDKNQHKALFVPRDHRIPRLNISSISWPDNFYNDAYKYENTLFVAKILDWFDTRFAIGNIVHNVGHSGDLISETKAILIQNNLDITPYGPEFRCYYPRLDYTIPEEEIKQREDIRKLCVFTIDPANCRDIDDGVSCRQLKNGNYEIGVHISDVTHYLAENTILDKKVANKATTIYLVDKAYHMLPDELCMLCSLFPGVDKLAFSVFWEIRPDSQVLSSRFSKTIIHSCCQLAYDHCQAILDDRIDSEQSFPQIYNGFSYKEISETIKILGKVSSILRRNRFENGALRIDQPKVTFDLSPENGLPSLFRIYESKESHQLIEEFMLLANMTVARQIYNDNPKLAFLRCHPPPSSFMLRQLVQTLEPMGIILDISTAGNLYKSLLLNTGPNEKQKGKAMVLNMLCAKPMSRAKYFCAGGNADDDFHHYALNVPFYTHFTSPIRRYADIIVHRLLASSIKNREALNWEIDEVCAKADRCNQQKYNTKKASEQSTELYMLKFIELNSPISTEAAVVEVKETHIDVIVVEMGLNRRIYFNKDFPGEVNCVKSEKGTKLWKMEITWSANGRHREVKQTIEVFCLLKIELVKGDGMLKVEARLVRPE